jgi:DNA phosphorothioation-associated putative methyltransferase
MRDAHMKIGKRIGSSVYVHVSTLAHLTGSITNCIAKAERIAAPLPFEANVYRIDERKSEVSLLKYRDFEIDSFPCLTRSVFVDLNAQLFSCRDFSKSSNPPILHRKELLLLKTHSEYSSLEELTSKLEALGLYKNANTIGHREQWRSRLRQAGLEELLM